MGHLDDFKWPEETRTPTSITAVLEGGKDFMVTLVLARTNPGAISVARNALRRV